MLVDCALVELVLAQVDSPLVELVLALADNVIVELVLALEGSGIVELVLVLVDAACNSLLAGKICVRGVSRRVSPFLPCSGKLRD